MSDSPFTPKQEAWSATTNDRPDRPLPWNIPGYFIAGTLDDAMIAEVEFARTYAHFYRWTDTPVPEHARLMTIARLADALDWMHHLYTSKRLGS